MLKSKLRKILAIMGVALVFKAINPLYTNAEWRKDNKGWWYSEGNSYIKNCWRQINGDWYYFDYEGYISTNTIIDGYYVDSNGILSEGSEEIQAYKKIFSNIGLLKNGKDFYIDDNVNKNKEFKPYNIKLVDLDGDGVSEAIANFGTSNISMRAIVFNYKDGEVKGVLQIYPNVYYCKDKHVLISHANAHGINPGKIYKYYNGKLVEVNSFEYNYKQGTPPPTCIIDNKIVTKKEFFDFIEQYCTDEDGRTFFNSFV